ncbi:hypothetical protein EDD37DRAFT_621543 [Exophiala viscosa]|uniref:uncharacterized protein n=1 Tax=Exophiala viscosa TaxID=2486360 RepID=UPI0021944118|nr:hypothetical protein EDD37DRAFT_621543 [Exophiala viscosa]
MPTSRVALAGATGNLGVPVLEALLGAGLSVTVLSRVGGNSSKLKQRSNLTIKYVDFNSTQSLASALQGIEVVVSCLATLAIGSQNPLIDASVAAGVKRFIPAEFGMDSLNPLCVHLPVCAPKAATQKYLEAKAQANPGFSWTGIANGLFLDWGLQVGFIIDTVRHTATLYSGGDIPFSTTTLADVARAVLGVIRNQDETADRLLYIHSTVTTQNKLIGYAKEKDGKTWRTTCKDTEDLRRERFGSLHNGHTMEAMDGFCVVAMFTPDYGCDFSTHLDNELVGVKGMDENDLRELVRGFVQ